MSDTLLRFQPFQSTIDPSFWADFTKLKLDDLRLSEKALQIRALYTTSSFSEIPQPVQVDSSSLQPASAHTSTQTAIGGELLNFNTLEGFKAADHGRRLQRLGAEIWRDVLSGAAEADPARLCRFLLLSHAELKTYRFYYWFAFPALKPPAAFTSSPPGSLVSRLGEVEASASVRASEAWLAQQQQRPPFWLLDTTDDTATAHPLSAWQEVRWASPILAAADPGNAPENPAWPCRNLLMLAAARWRLRRATVIAFRSRGGRLCAETSLAFEAQLPEIPEEWLRSADFTPEAVGWEANARGRPGPRVTDLGASMDPARLAAAAADLNVRLMKWRAAPALDVDRLAATRCLLLGAGTLGCAVARTLLGWGVRRITLLDNSRVSFSNPARQSLYEFADCLGGGVPKAAAAAARLGSILPQVEAEAVEMSIPMPGHPIAASEVAEAEASVARLDDLISRHDAVFLLMDTRESRWLPTLLCAARGRLAINAALGFDSFLVMRHGGPPADEEAAQARLGCYFCNDVVAPLNSTVDRTLDQQCTVARPGLAPTAGALAVELMAAVLQHPEGVAAPAGGAGAEGDGLALGAAPHMIRGQLTGFSQICLTGRAFRQCTACSATVVQHYKQDGWPWLLEALQDPKRLEDLTGLTELMSSAALADIDLESDGLVEPGSGDEEFVQL